VRSQREVAELLDELEVQTADALEDQDLDFKEWPGRSRADAVEVVVEMVVCMANGGGGTVVFGVADKLLGRARAVLGVPPEIDVNLLKKSVYDRTDPKLTPVFEELRVPEGTGRLLVMQVHPGLPPYTDSSGSGKIRVGRDCQPLTGTVRRRVMVETGETDFTAVSVPGDPADLVSAVAMERLRDAARAEGADDTLLRQRDTDLLGALGVLRDGCLTRAGVLLAGRDAAIGREIPGYSWTHLRMRSDVEYADREDGRSALPDALARLTARVMLDNPITTVAQGNYHFEYRTYPEIALREALLNALCHADYRLAGPVLVKQYRDRLEISNPGGLVGGISPDNILHHQPVARNAHLVEAMIRLRLVNRSNLGVSRMFSAMLRDGKEPPLIDEQGEAVRVVFFARELSVPFRRFVSDEEAEGNRLSVDELLVLSYLVRHGEIGAPDAARICQRREPQVREVLSAMERQRGYLERGGAALSTFWTLAPAARARLIEPDLQERDRRLGGDAAQALVLDVLRQRALSGAGLTNAELRAMLRLDRRRVYRLMERLRDVGAVRIRGRGRSALYTLADDVLPG